MSHKIAYGVGGLWFVIALVLWAVAVPATLSLSTLMWATAMVVGVIATALAVQRSGEQTRSIAGILYDTDHPGSTKS